MAIPLLPAKPVGFPTPDQALTEPDGLLAAGGDLTVEWLVTAYAHGIFPWFGEEDEHILWWSPGERAWLAPGGMRVTRSLKKRLRNTDFRVCTDRNFAAVVAGCQAPRSQQDGTWITQTMAEAYQRLHLRGLAHSFETYLDGQLVGGLYGVSLGRWFFGESMFSQVPDASKVAFFGLSQVLQAWSFTGIDCQLANPHLQSLGVAMQPRQEFLQQLAHNSLADTRQGTWQIDESSANLLQYAG
ncbi:MAG: leucyl/phenylalanyl-tRNA--protein transferase [Pseudomonadota bacterium]